MLKRQQFPVATGDKVIIPDSAPAPKLSTRQLKRVEQIRKEIDELTKQLADVLGNARP